MKLLETKFFSGVLSGRKTGIRKMGRHLAYGWGHGYLQWTPMFVKRGIVHCWNLVSCTLIGHSRFLLQRTPDELPECIHCCRGVEDPETEPFRPYLLGMDNND